MGNIVAIPLDALIFIGKRKKNKRGLTSWKAQSAGWKRWKRKAIPARTLGQVHICIVYLLNSNIIKGAVFTHRDGKQHSSRDAVGHTIGPSIEYLWSPRRYT